MSNSLQKSRVCRQICLIVCHLWSTGDRALRKRVLLLLHQKGHSLRDVSSVVVELAEATEDAVQQAHFRQLVSSMESEKPNPAAETTKADGSSESSGVPTKEELKERIALKRRSKRQRGEDDV